MDKEWKEKVEGQVYWTCCETDWRRGLYDEGTDLTRYRRQIHGGEKKAYLRPMTSSGRPVPVKLSLIEDEKGTVDDCALCTPLGDHGKPEPEGSTRGPLYLYVHKDDCRAIIDDTQEEGKEGEDGKDGKDAEPEYNDNDYGSYDSTPITDVTESLLRKLHTVDKIFLDVYREGWRVQCSCNGRILCFKATRLPQPFILY